MHLFVASAKDVIRCLLKCCFVSFATMFGDVVVEACQKNVRMGSTGPIFGTGQLSMQMPSGFHSHHIRQLPNLTQAYAF